MRSASSKPSRYVRGGLTFCSFIALIAVSDVAIADDLKALEINLYEPFLAKAKSSSLPRLSLTAQLIRSIDVAAPYRYQSSKYMSDPFNRLSMDNVFERYQLQLRANDADDSFYQLAGFGLKTGISMGAARYGGGGTLVGIGKDLAKNASINGIDTAIKEITTHGHEATQEWLKTELRKKAEFGIVENLASIEGLTATQKRQWLRDNKFVDELLEHSGEVREEDKPIVEGLLISALDKHIKAGLDLSVKVDAAQEAKIAEQAKQIVAVSRSLNEFKQETEDELQDIQQKQSEIADKVEALENRTDKNTADIEFLQKFMFDKMDPAEQIAALKSGMLSLSPDEQEKKITQIEILQKRQELTASVAKFGQGAASLANIARNLKVDPNIVKTLDDAAKVANVAQTVMVGMASGGLGYLSAAEAVTGFAFGGGDDGGAARHAEIMAALGEIKQGIAEIQQMLVQIGAQLDQIQQNQKTMMEALYKVSEQIDKNHRQEMEGITKIRTDLVPLAAMLNELLFKTIESCDVLSSRLKDAGFSWTTPIAFSQMQAIYQQRGDKCLDGLKDNLSNPFNLGTYYLNRFKDVPGSSVDLFVSDLYPKSVRLALRAQETFPLAKMIESFQRPVETIAAMDAKTKELKLHAAAAKTKLSARPPTEIEFLLKNPISAQTFIKHSGYLAALHPFFELQTTLQTGTEEDLLSQKSQSDEGYQLLRTVRDYFDLIISQQVMLSGDALLPTYEKFWLDGAADKRAEETDEAFAKRKSLRDDLEAALDTNNVLAANFVLQMASDQVRKNSNVIAYAFAYQLPGDPTYMRKIFSAEQFNLTPSAAGQPPEWTIAIGTKKLKLPKPIELSEGKLLHSPEVYPLLSARNQVQEQLDTYPQSSRFSKGDWGIVHEAVWFAAKVSAN